MLGTRAHPLWYHTSLAETFEIKLRAQIGEAADADKSVTILNRVLKLDAHGLSYEADPRHVELLKKSLGDDKITPQGHAW